MALKQKVRAVETEDSDGDSEQPENPAFNFAIDALRNITEINKQIAFLPFLPIPNSKRQELKIELVRNLFMFAVPLAPGEFSEEYRDEILALKQKTKPQSTGYKYIRLSLMFNPELDLELNKHIITIIMALQKKGYYMPPKSES